jgi:hypothetical protein
MKIDFASQNMEKYIYCIVHQKQELVKCRTGFEEKRYKVE